MGRVRRHEFRDRGYRVEEVGGADGPTAWRMTRVGPGPGAPRYDEVTLTATTASGEGAVEVRARRTGGDGDHVALRCWAGEALDAGAALLELEAPVGQDAVERTMRRWMETGAR